MGKNRKLNKIRYAVVGLGHIAQAAVLPAFEHAAENSQLTAFVSDNPNKIAELTKTYNVKNSWSYEQYDYCLRSGEIDAVYIALPNNMHAEFAIKAAESKIHVLCEKPMASSVKACQMMIEAARNNGVKLMVGYRLHFDEANMAVVDIVNSGRIGTPKVFNSVFTMQLRDGNIRSSKQMGGGPLNDIGIYCLNAARYIFRSEPIKVMAFASKSNNDRRFEEIDEMCAVILDFPENCLASFTCSFGAAAVSHYQVVGTKGDIVVDPAYEYADALKYRLTVAGKVIEEKTVPKHDQFAPELIHFSESILNNTKPEPSGEEGLADIHIIAAIQESINSGQEIKIRATKPSSRPGKDNIMVKPPTKKQPLVEVKSASKN